MLRLTRLSLRFPITAWAVLIGVTLCFAAGMLRLRTDVGYRAFLGAEHPAVERFDAFLDRYAGGLPMAAVWSCRDGRACESVFDSSALEMAYEVGAALRGNAAIRSVTSPAEAIVMVPAAFGALARRFIEDGAPTPDRESLAARALEDPAWVGQLVSSDGRVGAIAIEVNGSASETAVAAYHALDAALAPFAERGFEFHRVGGPVEFVVAGGELEAATARLIPLMVLLVGAIACALFRSLWVGGAALLTVGAAVLWSMGSLGWLGFAQNSLTQTLPPLVLVIGVCDAIHLVARYASHAAVQPPTSLEDRDRLLIGAASEVARPCTITTLTTAAGFLSFAGAELESFVEFGCIAAIGVIAALLLCFSLLPLLLRHRVPNALRTVRSIESWRRHLSTGLRAPEKHAGSVIAIALVVAAIATVGVARLRIDASFEELYGEQSRVVQWAHFVAQNLRRPDSLEIELTLPEAAELAAPEVLATIDDMARSLASIDELGPARSVLDPIRRSWQLMRPDEISKPWSDSAGENQALLAVAAAVEDDSGRDALRSWTDSERRNVRISLESEKPPQDRLREIMREVDAQFGRLPPGWSGSATGPLAVVHAMIDSIRAAQLESFATAALAVLVLVAIFLRSIPSAVLALIPTLLPIGLTLGTLGFLGIPLDVGSAMVAAVVLGVAVDDAIHLLEAFSRLRTQGLDAARAIREAVLDVGPALVTTSAALSVGFAALTFSPWKSVASFGLVSSLAIAAALFSTLLVLPALILIAARDDA